MDEIDALKTSGCLLYEIMEQKSVSSLITKVRDNKNII